MDSSGRVLFIAISGFSLAALLWGAGLATTPRGVYLGLLLLAAALLGTITVAGTTWDWVQSRRLKSAPADKERGPLTVSLGLGLLTLMGTGSFLAGVFGTDPVDVSIYRGPSEPRSTTHPPRRLRVLVLNVLHGYPHFQDQEARYRRTLQAFRALEPDVLMLQEAWRSRKHGDLVRRMAQDLHLDAAYTGANGSLRFLGFEEGSAVLSRYKIRHAERIVLKPRKPPWERRVALVVSLSIAGEGVTFVSLHLTHRSEETAGHQAETLASRLDTAGALVVAGDFNAPSDSQAVKAFLRRDMVDLVPGGIDHLLVSQPLLDDWRIAAARRELEPEKMRRPQGRQVAISDHPALVVDLVRRPRG